VGQLGGRGLVAPPPAVRMTGRAVVALAVSIGDDDVTIGAGECLAPDAEEVWDGAA